MTTPRLFPDEPYHFSLNLHRGQPSDFFGPTAENAPILAERARWLESSPATCLACLPEGAPLLAEAIELAAAWGTLSPAQLEAIHSCPDDSSQAAALGRAWEPDYLLLTGREGVRLLAGAVCFPSSWVFEEKIGQTITEIHSVVPGLNQDLGPAIHAFLSKLRPGVAWRRENWSLASTPERNQHPSRRLPKLGADVTLATAWLRIEHQALVALPRSQGVLFGIRIESIRLDQFCADPIAARGLRNALATMPEAMAAYKSIALARPRLVELLGSA